MIRAWGSHRVGAARANRDQLSGPALIWPAASRIRWHRVTRRPLCAPDVTHRDRRLLGMTAGRIPAPPVLAGRPFAVGARVFAALVGEATCR